MHGLSEIKKLNDGAVELSRKGREWHMAQAKAWDELAREPGISDAIREARAAMAQKEVELANGGPYVE